MRTLGLCLVLVGAVGVVSAQAPAMAPFGTLNQVMRGILYPNSNIIFDVQTTAPAADDTAVYGGWTLVESSTVALGEAANLLLVPGRLCENGRPVPSQRADWITYVEGLRAAMRQTYTAVQSRSQDAVIDATEALSESCENCHAVYRDKPTMAERCLP